MARSLHKHSSDRSQDAEILNNLQEWERLVKDDGKKVMSPSFGQKDIPAQRHNVNNTSQFSGGQSSAKNSESSQNIRTIQEDTRPYDYLRGYNAISHVSSGFMTQESSVDANSEKELGNEYFKQKKFNEAIDSYSRSIALSPTAVAYANRAMAYLKIKRFQEAEDDCTESLNLDDRYIKAYSRRSTARKELGKLKDSIEDTEFALRLEPQNQEMKKQYAEVKSLYQKELLKKASGSLRGSMQEAQKARKLEMENDIHVQGTQAVPSSSQMAKKDVIQEYMTKDSDGRVPAKTSVEKASISVRIEEYEVNASPGDATQNFAVEGVKKNRKAARQEFNTSVQKLADRAASLAMAEAAKNIAPPSSAYQFEVSWRGLSGDRTLQSRLLKATSPVALPQIFKNALSAPLLIDIIRCLATFFSEETDLAIKYLENLTKVARFDMLIMCLSSMDKADLAEMWNEVFCSQDTPREYAEILSNLRSKYCPKL